ncbi:hypothetical protein Hamer_G019323 [Homarus americanus]|uniref:Uncharacterized protein n=1 Tax=Homarus americanus TaxID=6706 RepID=A0A8J5MMV3_HOMAM|nr:hypothetical protein Hamer_G019323 [Homarus americanus]
MCTVIGPKEQELLGGGAVFCLAEIYACDVKDLSHELHQAKRILERKAQSGMQKLSSVLELTVFLQPYKEVFNELFHLCRIALAPPSKQRCL